MLIKRNLAGCPKEAPDAERSPESHHGAVAAPAPHQRHQLQPVAHPLLRRLELWAREPLPRPRRVRVCQARARGAERPADRRAAGGLGLPRGARVPAALAHAQVRGVFARPRPLRRRRARSLDAREERGERARGALGLGPRRAAHPLVPQVALRRGPGTTRPALARERPGRLRRAPELFAASAPHGQRPPAARQPRARRLRLRGLLAGRELRGAGEQGAALGRLREIGPRGDAHDVPVRRRRRVARPPAREAREPRRGAPGARRRRGDARLRRRHRNRARVFSFPRRGARRERPRRSSATS